MSDPASAAADQVLQATGAERPGGWARWCRGPAATATARGVVCLAAALLTLRLVTYGGFRLNDAARHAMSGVFLLDMLREGGYWHPVTYAEAYYARYPCLGIPNYYPPLFHTVEAAFFAVLGISAPTARLTVAAYHVLGVWALFELVRRTSGTALGFWAAWFYLTNPLVLFWSRQTMLEAPSVCMMLLASLALDEWLRRGGRWRAMLWLLGLAGCLATKQTTAFLLPVHGLVVLSAHGRSLVRRPLTWWLLGLLACGGLGYLLVTAASAPFHLRAVLSGPAGSRLSWQHLSCFPAKLPTVVGWEVLAAASAGALWSWIDPLRRPAARLWWLWLIGFYLFQIGLTGHHARYAFLWMPPFAVLAAYGLMAAWREGRPRWLALALAAVLVVPVTVRAVRSEPPWITGHEQAAQFVAALDGGAAVLIDGAWDGDFVFFSRQYDPRRRLVLRGSKMLYTFASYRDVQFRNLIESDQELFDFLQRYAVRYVVVEDYDVARTEPGARLRRLVRTEAFRPLAQIPVRNTGGLLRARTLEVYEYPAAQTPTAPELEIQFPGLDRVIRVPLDTMHPADREPDLPRSP